MRIDMISLFPDMFTGPFSESIVKRAAEKGILDIHVTNPRDFTFDRHHQVDDSPFGGGSGMVLKPEPIFRAVAAVKAASSALVRRHIILTCPGGATFSQAKAKELADYEQLIFICGHYEGYDARIVQNLADEALSIGDYVLTGGELPAMVMTDAVARMLPDVLGSEESAVTDSFYSDILEYPQYTRPREYCNMQVPEVLLSGNHAAIAEWRRQEALRLTMQKRPDLLREAALTQKDKDFLFSLGYGCD